MYKELSQHRSCLNTVFRPGDNHLLQLRMSVHEYTFYFQIILQQGLSLLLSAGLPLATGMICQGYLIHHA